MRAPPRRRVNDGERRPADRVFLAVPIPAKEASMARDDTIPERDR